jgi:hypothetical protein
MITVLIEYLSFIMQAEVSRPYAVYAQSNGVYRVSSIFGI